MPAQTHPRKWVASGASGVSRYQGLSADELIQKMKEVKERGQGGAPVHILFPKPIHKRWPFDLDFAPESEELNLLNGLSYYLPTEEIVPILCDLLDLWRLCAPNAPCHKEYLADAIKVFGDLLAPVVGFRLMFTLNREGGEFRCWYGIPGYLGVDENGQGYDHVDSDGEGLLFYVRGQPDEVKKYVEGILDQRAIKHAITIPNGVTFYGFHWGRIG